jgi:CRISPR-associated protein Csm1
MSVQLFLEGQLTGIEDFLLAPSALSADERVIAGRCQWTSLLCEVVPRALLAELGLSPQLLGASGGGRFLIVLPEEARERAEAFLTGAADDARNLSGGRLRLNWALTENLGGWPVVRQRLSAQLSARKGTPWAAGLAAIAAPDDGYFSMLVSAGLRESAAVGWSAAEPAHFKIGEGERSWPLGDGPDAISLARHAALADDGASPASLAVLASRASGASRWGILRGDVDHFSGRLAKAQTVEEHIQLSLVMKQFLNGELELIASLPEFWRKVAILYAGGDDFAVYGAWDALIDLAREIQRLFHRFAGVQLAEASGAEGKTISMALAVAQDEASEFGFVWEEAGRGLMAAKAAGKDCFFVLGRVIDWKQLERSSELKNLMIRLVRDQGCSPDFLPELSGFFHDRLASPGRERSGRPWRYQRRIVLALGEPAGGPGNEFSRKRNALISELIGRGSAQARLRPSGRVAVDWARLELDV